MESIAINGTQTNFKEFVYIENGFKFVTLISENKISVSTQTQISITYGIVINGGGA